MKRVRLLLAMLAGMVAFVAGGSAFATAPSDGAGVISSAQDNFNTVLVPAAAGLILAIVLFWLGVKIARKVTGKA